LSFLVQSTKEHLENTGGIALAAELARISGLTKLRFPVRTWSGAILSMFGLLCMGRSAYEDIATFRKNELFRSAFGLEYVPARETLRIYLGRMARKVHGLITMLFSCNIALLKRAAITPIDIEGRRYIPVDVDVSTLDNGKSHKEGVGRTYLGTDGYAPIFSYIGTEGYMLECELRPGTQHSQKGTPEFLARNLQMIKELGLSHPVLFRLDSGNDAIDTIKKLVAPGCFFLIKRNLRREPLEQWHEIAETLGIARHPRPGKTVYTGTITKSHPMADVDMPEFDIVFEVTVRTNDHRGDDFLVPEVEVETWWTNLFESPATIIALYHDHGTSEQFHSELKTDMDVERLPSGSMKVNELVLTISMLAFNTLRFIGQRAIAKPELLPSPPAVARKRLRKVISDLILIGCKLVQHGRQLILRIWNGNPWLPVFDELYAEFLTL